MICVFYGNCQTNVYKSFFETFTNFKVISYVNYEMIKSKEKIPYNILQKANIFIYQHINNEEYHPSKFISQLPDNCTIIKIQSLHCKIYFPDSIQSQSLIEHMSQYEPFGVISYGHDKIDIGKNFYEKQELQVVYETFQTLIEKDAEFDTKIYDFINKNFRNERLFFTIDHPSNKILRIIIYQILDILNIKPCKDDHDFWVHEHMNSYIDYIHADIYEFFGLKFPKMLIKTHDNVYRNDEEFLKFYKDVIKSHV